MVAKKKTSKAAKQGKKGRTVARKLKLDRETLKDLIVPSGSGVKGGRRRMSPDPCDTCE